MAGIDKVWASLGSHPLVWHSLSQLAPAACETVLVVRADMVNRAQEELHADFPDLVVVDGGSDRRESVANGLAVLQGAEIIAVHDAARPFGNARMMREGRALLAAYHGAVPVTPIHDTIKCVSLDGMVVETVDRASLRAVQTPQVFRADALRAAHRGWQCAAESTDDAGLLEANGYQVATFSGDILNIKVTTAEDLMLAHYLLSRRKS
ncbi:MAG: 2-C-methyl-D-erythritol 4-phosphate cytidylyltransferase [Chloroflexota bacterium]|nr:2-C-methyl-D-erythritol 4-phosphate cytidylyltransferase [Chloroflexota bacterium]